MRVWFAIMVGLAGCAPDAGGGNATPPTENVTGAVANEAAPEPPAKSILRPEVAEPEPAAPVLAPHDVVIGFGDTGSRLDDAARQALDAILADPVLAAGGAITLRGHSDSKGSDGDNLVVSRKRAEAVRDYLTGKGVAADRIVVIAMGEAAPLVPNRRPDGSDDPEAQAKNRRVEVHVAVPAQDPPSDAETDAEVEASQNRL